MKISLVYVLLLISLVLAGCGEVSFADPAADSGGEAQKAWIMLTNPYDGQRLPLDGVVDVRSESVSPEKLKAALLMVNGSLYRRDEFSAALSMANIYLPWTPRAPGIYRLQTILEDAGGGQYLSNIITVYVDAVEEEVVLQITDTPALEIEEGDKKEECPRPLAITRSSANCRSGPGIGYDMVTGYNAGQSLFVIGRIASGNWWQVERQGGGSCWLWSDLVDVCGNTDSVSLVNLPEKDEVVVDPTITPTKKPTEKPPEKPTVTPTWDPNSGPTTP